MPVCSCFPLEVFNHTDGDGKLEFGRWILLLVGFEEMAELNDELAAAMDSCGSGRLANCSSSNSEN